MTAQAPGAFAGAPIPASAPAVPIATAPLAGEVPLPATERLRAGLTGFALAALALAAATAIALLIVTGPFHTSLGSIG